MTTDEQNLSRRLKDAVAPAPDDLIAKILSRAEFGVAPGRVRTRRVNSLQVAIAAVSVAVLVTATWWVARPAPPQIGTAPSTPSVTFSASTTTTSTVPPADALIANPKLSLGDGQQGMPCDGSPRLPIDHRYFLNPAATVVAGVVCSDETRHVPGQGFWDGIAERAMTVDQVAAIRHDLLAAADQAMITPPQTGCDLDLQTVPSFVLTTSADTKIRPFIPGIACTPIGDAPDLLARILSINPVTGFSPVTRVSTDEMATSGCFSAGLVGLDALVDEKGYEQHSKQHRPTGDLPSAVTEPVSVCRYSPPYRQDAHVVARGLPALRR